MNHASRRSKDEQHDELMAAVADGVKLALREMRPEIEKALAVAGEKLAADLVKAQAKAVRTAATTARINVR